MSNETYMCVWTIPRYSSLKTYNVYDVVIVSIVVILDSSCVQPVLYISTCKHDYIL